MAPLSTTAIHSAYFEGITYIRENKWKDALDVFKRLVARFPDGLNAPEAQYHVGLSLQQLGDQQGAIDAWEETRKRYPDSPWATHAGERLAELHK
jgi:TolA-binding protein